MGYQYRVVRHPMVVAPVRHLLVVREEPRQEPPEVLPPALKPCGTYPAYIRHIRNGEEPDPECMEALRAYSRARNARARQRKLNNQQQNTKMKAGK
jgi:hypothetical protein